MKRIPDEDILAILETARQDAVEFQRVRSDNRLKWLKYYRQEPYGNEVDGWCRSISSDVWDAVEGLKPNLVERFTGDFFKLKCKYQEKADANTKLIKYQLYKHNKFEQTLDQNFIYQVLNTDFGVLKAYYTEEWRERKQKIPRIPLAAMEQMQQDDKIEVKAAIPVEEFNVTGEYWSGYEDVTILVKERVFKGFKVESVPGSEFYISSDAKDVETARLVEHWVPKTLDYIAKMEKAGVFRKGSTVEVAEKLDYDEDESGSVEAEEQDRILDGSGEYESLMGIDTNDPLVRPNAPVRIIESYFRLDMTGQGVLEPVVITTCNNVVLAIQENMYQRPPFFICAGFPQAHRIDGTALGAILEHEQKDKTNLKRAMIDGYAQASMKTPVTSDPQLVNVLKKRTVRTVVQGDFNRLDWIEHPSPDQGIFKALEFSANSVEEKTPYSRMAQGSTDAGNALNKTASGMNMVLTSAARKERLLARRIARCLEEVIRFCLWINENIGPPHDIAQILDLPEGADEEQIKQALLKESEYEIEVVVGLGPQDKIEAAQLLDQYVQYAVQAGIQLGTTKPSHIAKAIKRKHQLLDVPIESMMVEVEEIEKQEQTGENQLKQQFAQMQEQMQQVSQQIQGLTQEIQKRDTEIQQLKNNNEVEKTKHNLEVNTLQKLHRLELQSERSASRDRSNRGTTDN